MSDGVAAVLAGGLAATVCAALLHPAAGLVPAVLLVVFGLLVDDGKGSV
jgi:hypothetical protein